MRWTRGWAHPRSRGENRNQSAQHTQIKGSSPLTRGKLGLANQGGLALRLIPAHAGKTGSGGSPGRDRRAHPRSRGENRWRRASPRRTWGSSPLTRGKQALPKPPIAARGLIPAHAGKTVPRPMPATLPWAHPRSRGENMLSPELTSQIIGSSPLTRGKPCALPSAVTQLRLIPAHAGKTRLRALACACLAAHPRSRGENVVTVHLSMWLRGSSPLTRGKQWAAGALPGTLGLIPAHAGKTLRPAARMYRVTAHPRSRGENAIRGFP